MQQPLHLIIGPAQHGVTEYARLLHAEMGGPCVSAPSLDALDRSLLADHPDQPLHVTFTDHLYGASPDQAVDNVVELAGQRPLSVSFHDIPQPEEGEERFRRRAGAYRRLARRAQVAVVNSHHEATFFSDQGIDVDVIHLPLPEPLVPAAAKDDVEPDSFGLIGFVYPGKGHQRVIESLDFGRVVALGTCSDGHEYMAEELADIASRRGVGFELTGFLSDEEMWRRMGHIAVPVCAHHHFSASGSLMRWIAAGRRVLVADSDYAREIDRAFPGLIRLVGDDEWPAALRAAASDQEFPRPRPTVAWTWSEVADRWRRLWSEHLFPPVSVIIPHYNAPDRLADVLRALEAQTYPGPLEVIVADDGSDTLPDPETSLPLTVVGQEDRGFRAAAARDLGAGSAQGDILCFLDGDTVPRNDYIRAAVAPILADPDALVVGTRLSDGHEAEWLADAYRRTKDLTTADDSAFRFVISAVMSCSRDLYHRVRFDSSMVGYGGEDWVFAHVALKSGARLVHAPRAVADHSEPDWDERTGIDVAEKNAESIAVAHRITHPIARPDGVIFHSGDIEVILPTHDLPAGVRDALTVRWLQAGGANLHVVGESSELFSADPRVHPDSRSPRWVITLNEPFAPRAPLADADTHLAPGLIYSPTGQVVGRIEKIGHTSSPDQETTLEGEIYSDEIRLERFFAGW